MKSSFLPITMYHDYAINEHLFHLHSNRKQRATRSRAGQGLHPASRNRKAFILFVREQTKDEYGRTMGFINYGEVDSYLGSQPHGYYFEA